MIAKPFIKWVGGKQQLIEQLENLFPQELKTGEITHYTEPFLGGGALFFYVFQKYNLKTAYLSDVNKDLILTYQSVQQKPNELLSFLEQYQKNYDATNEEKRTELFLKVRSDFNLQRIKINYNSLENNSLERAAQFIFLNKTCFNGLFRLNAKGDFNVPFGKYKTANIFDESNILAASKVLQNAEIVCGDYSLCFSKVQDNSFVYFDPPYRPLSTTASFTTYTGTAFTDKSQIKLSLFFQKLDKEKNVKLMLSNSDPTNENPTDAFFDRAYTGYHIHKVWAKRAVNSKGDKRGKINELLITNYQYQHEPSTLALHF